MSADAGRTWSAANAGLAATSGSASRSVRAMVTDGQYIYTATDSGIYCAAAGAAAGAAATDLPAWTKLNDTGAARPVSLLAVDPSAAILFAATSTSTFGSVPVVYMTSVSGLCAATAQSSWSASPLPAETADSGIGAITVVPASGARPAGLLVGAGNRTYVASVPQMPAALEWVDADPFGSLFAIGAIETLHYSADFSQAYACSGGQLFRMSNPFDPPLNTWLQMSVSPMPAAVPNCTAMTSGGFAAGGPAVVAVATDVGVYTSFNGTDFMATSPLSVSPVANALVVTGGAAPSLYVAGGFGVASQSNAALTLTSAWAVNNGPANVSPGGGSNGRLNNARVVDSAVLGSTLFAAVRSEQYGDVLTSSDAGASWVPTGLSNIAGSSVEVTALIADAANGIVYAGTLDGLFALSVSAGTWAAVSSANISRVNSLAQGRSLLYVGSDAGVLTLPLGATPSTVMAVAAGLAGLRVSALHVADGKVFAGTYDSNVGLASVAVATDALTGAAAWYNFATGTVGPYRIHSLSLIGTSLLAATSGGLVSVAAPGGAWTSANNSASSADWLSDANGVVRSLFSDGAMVYAATQSNGIFRSPIGATFLWAAFNGDGNTALPSLEVRALRADGDVLYASTAAGLATYNGIAASGSPTPTPAPDNSGGGAVDPVSLFLLLLLVVFIGTPTPARRPPR